MWEGCGEAMRGSECHGRGFEFDPGSLQRMGPEFCLQIELSKKKKKKKNNLKPNNEFSVMKGTLSSVTEGS